LSRHAPARVFEVTEEQSVRDRLSDEGVTSSTTAGSGSAAPASCPCWPVSSTTATTSLPIANGLRKTR
jgi:hypothetical protein